MCRNQLLENAKGKKYTLISNHFKNMLRCTLNYVSVACACIILFLIIFNWPDTEHFQNTPTRFPRIIHQYFEPFTTNQMQSYF